MGRHRFSISVAVFSLVFFLVCCAPSQEEKLASALREVERFAEMRKKAREIVLEQELRVIVEARDYQEWETLERELLHWRNVDVEFAERKLKGLKGSGRDDEIAHWQTELQNARGVYDRQAEEVGRRRLIKVQNLQKMRADLALSKAAYDSINVLHTAAVVELSKHKNTQED